MAATTRAATVTPRDRLAVASRIVAATAVNYALAALAATAIGATLSDAAAATIVSTLVGLLLMPIAAMVCFHARSATRAWAGLALAAALCLIVAIASGWRP